MIKPDRSAQRARADLGSRVNPEPGTPLVAIVGRPNVGKSALFNRLLRRGKALVDATPGVTRDRLYGQVQWQGRSFQIVDTGGLQFAKKDRLAQLVADQVAKAMGEASLALFLCDAKQGVVALDRQVTDWIRPWGRPVLLVVNKVDTEEDLAASYEFASLGIGEPLAISSLHGRGIGELLDAIVETLPRGKPLDVGVSPKAVPLIRVAVIGRPNVGKSSLVNRILNEERVLVDEEPGTTRDPVEAFFRYQGEDFCLIDTAGIRSKRRLPTKMDYVARLKAWEMIRTSDVCLGVLEGPLGIVQEDRKLLGLAQELGKPVCLAINKWDLVKEPIEVREVASGIAQKVPFLRFAPVVLTSAKTGLNVLALLDQIRRLAKAAMRRITQEEQDRLFKAIREDPKAPAALRYAVLLRLTQVGVAPPTFHLTFRGKRAFQESDVTYLKGVFRRQLNLPGVPIRVRLLRA